MWQTCKEWYVSRKDWGRGLDIIEDSVDASVQWLEDCIEKRGGRLIRVTRNNTDNMGLTEWQWPENKNGKKNNSMDVLSD